MNNPPARGSSFVDLKGKTYPTILIECIFFGIFENEGDGIRQNFLGKMLLIMLSCFVVTFTDILAYSGM